MFGKSLVRRALFLVHPFWGRLLGISMLILVLSGTNQIQPLLYKALIDLITNEEVQLPFFSRTNFAIIAIAFVGIKIFSAIINRIIQYASVIMGSQIKFYLREIGLKHLFTLSVDYYNKHQSGKIISKLSRGTHEIHSLIVNLCQYFLPNFITGIFAVFIVAKFSLQVGVATALIFIPFSLLRYMRYKTMVKLSKKQNLIWDKDYGRFWEAITNFRLVKSFNAENYETERVRHVTKKLMNGQKNIEKEHNKGIFADILLDGWISILAVYLFWQALSNHYTVGTVVLLVSYINLIKEPLWNMSWIFWEIKEAVVSIKDYFDLVDTKPSISEINHPVILHQIEGQINFKNVWFKYPEKDGNQVFNNLSFTVSPGQVIALVGKSGVGKSTIANLLIRFYDPDRGTITLDGYDLRDLSLNSLRSQVGLVMQENYLFDDTIINNVRYGRPSATIKEVEEACHAANAWEFIHKLPKGLNTLIGERGVRLSGGQKQRLSIARTILKDPKILILDEATSSLDSHSEKLVQDALWKLIKGRTTIIIAHRLSTIQKADKIIVLENKKVVEEGTHKDLINKKGIYSSLHAIQSGNVEKLKKWDLVS